MEFFRQEVLFAFCPAHRAQKKSLAARAGQALVWVTPRADPVRQRTYLPLLLLLDFFSPPWLLRLLLLPRLALARSLCALLFGLPALPPLLAASDRLMLPPDDPDLRNAIEVLLVSYAARTVARAAS